MKSKLFSFFASIVGLSPLIAADTHQINQEKSMQNYQIVRIPSMTIIGIECRTSNAPEAGSQDIPMLWGKFLGENTIDKIPNKTNNEVIALYCDYEGDYTQRYTLVIGCAASSADQVPEGMVVKQIPSATYAVFRAVGEHPKALIETWGNIWQTNLARTYTGDFEVYGDKFISGSPQEVEVYIAIKNKEVKND